MVGLTVVTVFFILMDKDASIAAPQPAAPTPPVSTPTPPEASPLAPAPTSAGTSTPVG